MRTMTWHAAVWYSKQGGGNDSVSWWKSYAAVDTFEGWGCGRLVEILHDVYPRDSLASDDRARNMHKDLLRDSSGHSELLTMTRGRAMPFICEGRREHTGVCAHMPVRSSYANAACTSSQRADNGQRVHMCVAHPEPLAEVLFQIHLYIVVETANGVLI